MATLFYMPGYISGHTGGEGRLHPTDRKRIMLFGAMAVCAFFCTDATKKARDAMHRALILPKKGVEPSRPCGQGILSPRRLPFRHFGSAKIIAPIWRSVKQKILRAPSQQDADHAAVAFVYDFCQHFLHLFLRVLRHLRELVV